MTDSWSLKGKVERGYGMCVAPPMIYLKEDIDTLRKLLIEKFINRLKNECGTCGQAVILDDEIKEIINTLFGVD